MKGGSRKIKSIKKKIRRMTKRRRHSRKNKRTMRGGYAQYQNNMPMSPSYQVAGINLSSSQSALANPPPITKLDNCVNCVDNYNHNTNIGTPSKGH